MSAVTKNLRDGVLVIYDGATPAEEITVVCDDGDLTFTPAVDNPGIAVMDRGSLDHLRPGDEGVTEGSFTVKFKEFLSQDSNPVTPWEALRMEEGASDWVTTNDDGGGVQTVGLEFTVVTPTSTEVDEVVTFAKCYDIEVEFAEGDEYDTMKVSFKDFETCPTIAKASEAASSAGS